MKKPMAAANSTRSSDLSASMILSSESGSLKKLHVLTYGGKEAQDMIQCLKNNAPRSDLNFGSKRALTAVLRAAESHELRQSNTRI